MTNEKFVIDYKKQESLKKALELAVAYCDEHAPNADSWSKQGLLSLREELAPLVDSIGNSFVVGHFE